MVIYQTVIHGDIAVLHLLVAGFLRRKDDMLSCGRIVFAHWSGRRRDRFCDGRMNARSL